MTSFIERFPDAAELLCGRRPENFPFERLADLGRLVAWMVAPAQDDLIEIGAKSAVALGVRETLKRRNPDLLGRDPDSFLADVMARHFTAEFVVDTLILWPPFDWETEFENQWYYGATATCVAQFLLQISQHGSSPSQASMNRAINFVCLGGYAVEDGYEQSHATVRACWKDHAIATPMQLATEQSGIMYPSFSFSTYYLWLFYKSTLLFERMNRLFSVARSIQEKLLNILPQETSQKFVFPKFPDFVSAEPTSFPEFTERQLKIIRSYRAPVPGGRQSAKR